MNHPAKTKILAMGRRWGKTVLGGVVTMNVLRQHGRVAWIVPEYKNGRALWRYAANVCAGPAQAGYIDISKSERVITTHGGGFFGIYSADNIDSIRSEAFHVVVRDEAARQAEEGLQDAVIPTLADYNGERLDISSPKGKNYFFTEFMAGMADGKDLASWTAPTYANPNPNIQKAFAEIKRRSELGLYSKRSFEQEWMAKFVDDGALFQNIEACATSKREPYIVGHTYGIGADWARASGGDYTVFSVLDANTKRQVEMIRMAGAPFDQQVARLETLSKQYGNAPIMAEYNSMGGPLVEQMQIHGLSVMGFVTTASSKHEIITALELAFDRKEIFILPDPVQIQEMSSFERIERAGLPAYGAPVGMHDDTVIGLALAWKQITHGIMIPSLDPFD